MNTTYFLNCAAGNIFNTKTSPALPKTYYIGLSTSAPAINGTGVNEPSTDAGYARVKLSSLGEPVDGVVTNSQAINFNESTRVGARLPISLFTIPPLLARAIS